MKKTSTRLQLTKTTVRVLSDAELRGVRGGVVLLEPVNPSKNPTAC